MTRKGTAEEEANFSLANSRCDAGVLVDVTQKTFD